MLPVAVARSSYDVNVLPVFRMTSCFHIIERTGKIRDDALFRWVRQVAAPAAKSAVSDCILLVECWLSARWPRTINYMESTLREYNSPRKQNFGVGIILPDRYFHIPLPIVTKHEFGLPFPFRNLPVTFGTNPSTIFLVIVVTDRHTNQRR